MRTLFLAFNNPAGDEEEYNRWYDEVHVPAVLQLDGFVSARRFRLSDARPPTDPLSAYRYLAVYELDTDDLPDAFRRLREARDAGLTGAVADFVEADPMQLSATYVLVRSDFPERPSSEGTRIAPSQH